MHISTLHPDDATAVEQAAEALFFGFQRDFPGAWPDLAAAREEVAEALEDGKICRVARNEGGSVLGWIGGQLFYERVWELHPLVVHPDAQGRGIGRALVADLEVQVRQRGGLTIHLGSDDVSNMTSLGGVDLYPDVWVHLNQIQNLRGHPYEFYQKCGFVISGVVPDANGLGKPDILMAKRVAKG